MSIVTSLISYLSIAIFLVAVVWRIRWYLSLPLHVRWELYPVAHEGKRAAYGGSYLEDVDWWKKPREVSKLNEIKFMIPEILLLKGVWESNRSLWYWSFPFHFGLYLISAFIGLLALGALLEPAAGALPTQGALSTAIAALTNFVGPMAYVLCLVGACGLLVRRLTNDEIRNYSSFSHYFNLLFFIGVMVLSIASWLFFDPSFVSLRAFLKSLVTLSAFEPQHGNRVLSGSWGHAVVGLHPLDPHVPFLHEIFPLARHPLRR